MRLQRGTGVSRRRPPPSPTATTSRRSGFSMRCPGGVPAAVRSPVCSRRPNTNSPTRLSRLGFTTSPRTRSGPHVGHIWQDHYSSRSPRCRFVLPPSPPRLGSGTFALPTVTMRWISWSKGRTARWSASRSSWLPTSTTPTYAISCGFANVSQTMSSTSSSSRPDLARIGARTVWPWFHLHYSVTENSVIECCPASWTGRGSSKDRTQTAAGAGKVGYSTPEIDCTVRTTWQE